MCCLRQTLFNPLQPALCAPGPPAQRFFLQARGRRTMPTGEEGKRAIDKTKLAERKRLMDAIVATVRPAADSSKEKAGARNGQKEGGK